jgi:hypothetical protein
MLKASSVLNARVKKQKNSYPVLPFGIREGNHLDYPLLRAVLQAPPEESDMPNREFGI